MDAERLRFVFGTDQPGLDDVDDEDELIAFFEHELEADGDGDDDFIRPRAAIHTVLARQILRDEPPEVWQTVERLRNEGLGRAETRSQVAMALMQEIQRALADQRDDASYRASLDRLPIPRPRELDGALEAAVAGQPGIGTDAATDAVLARFDRADDELTRSVINRIIERSMENETFAMLVPDRLVYPPTITEGIVLTHRLNESEVDLEALMWVGSDLAGFAWHDELTCSAGEVETFSMEYGHVGWTGPEGWLAGFAAGDVLAVRIDANVVHPERLDDEPAHDEQLIRAVRRFYDVEVEEAGLPIPCHDIVYAVLVEDRSAFDHPRPPLSEICERAGLEVRGPLVGHDESVWREDARLRRSWRAHDRFEDDPERAHEVLELLDVVDDSDASSEQLRDVLERLLDDEVCFAVLDLLVDVDEPNADDVAVVEDFAHRALDGAETRSERMMAHFVRAVVAERAGDLLVADAQYRLAVDADAEWGPAIDRAAWYASDRGDARNALNLWRMLEEPDEDEVRAVETAAARAPSKRGRNDPCWCGSGRKQKACHRDAPEPIPLPDRVHWLMAKAIGYAWRRGGEADTDALELAIARAPRPDDAASVTAVFRDPVVLDAMLVELKWFNRFLEDRGSLLPEDEREIAEAWSESLLRSVYEVEEVRADGAVVRELFDDVRVEVRPHRADLAFEVGDFVCARAASDGVAHQFVGVVLPVAADDVDEVLAIVEDNDAFGLCEYAARVFA